MTPLLTRQTIWIFGILLGGCLGLAVAQAQDRQPAIVAPGDPCDQRGRHSSWSQLKTPYGPAWPGYPKMPVSVS